MIGLKLAVSFEKNIRPTVWFQNKLVRMILLPKSASRVVYTNFPWPDATAEQRERVEEKARAVLAAREPYLPPRGLGTLADLYDPLSMPPELLRAHTELDRAVDLCYRPEKFESDRERVEFLFTLYEKLTAPLLPAARSKKGRRSQ